MTKVLIINTPALTNRGGMAVVIGALGALRKAIPDAQITVLCHHCNEDWDLLEQICAKQGVEVKRHPWFKEHDARVLSLVHSAVPAAWSLVQAAMYRVVGRIGVLPKSVFQDADVILDLNIDALHDNYGIFFPTWALSNIALGIVSGKPVVVWSAGIGRFRRRPTRLFARLVLNRVDMILAREAVTKEYLYIIGVTRPKVLVTADHAFAMEPAPSEKVREIFTTEGISKDSGPLIALAPSQGIKRYAFPSVKLQEEKYSRYLDVMAQTADYLVERLKATVILVPHSIVSFSDDRVVCTRILEQVKTKDKVKLLSGEYMADELKGVIGACDLLIGCRMHATIASTSMGVPTIAIVYGQKSHGIIGDMMGQGRYVLQIEDLDSDGLLSELKGRIDELWTNRASIRSELEERAQRAREQALLNSTLVRDLLPAG